MDIEKHLIHYCNSVWYCDCTQSPYFDRKNLYNCIEHPYGVFMKRFGNALRKDILNGIVTEQNIDEIYDNACRIQYESTQNFLTNETYKLYRGIILRKDISEYIPRKIESWTDNKRSAKAHSCAFEKTKNIKGIVISEKINKENIFICFTKDKEYKKIRECINENEYVLINLKPISNKNFEYMYLNK